MEALEIGYSAYLILQTPLLAAVWKGQDLVCKYLLENGANADLTTHINKRSPLFVASWKGYDKVCKVLLEHGSNPLIADYKGQNALSVAVQHGNYNCCSLIFELGNQSKEQIISASVFRGRGVIDLAKLIQNIRVVSLLEGSINL